MGDRVTHRDVPVGDGVISGELWALLEAVMRRTPAGPTARGMAADASDRTVGH